MAKAGGTDRDEHAYTYDAAGNLTDLAATIYRGANSALTHRRLVYDAFGRLVRVAAVEGMDETDVAVYRYNGLNMRLMWQDDADADSSLESSERFYVMHDERWRPVATFRDTDTTPKEAFVWHAAGGAGQGGFGGSSYIDSIILRDRDNYTGGTPNPMTSASDGTLEERRVFCQNWRADVVAITKSDGTPIEYVRYSAYGEPTVYPVADLNMDGVVNSTDSGLWSDLIYIASNSSVYADTDLDWDGADDQASSGIDSDLFYESYAANTGLSGIGRMSSPSVGNRTGYAGYQWDQTISACHVRYRVYLPDIGRWTRRDPLGYVDGMGLTAFLACSPIVRLDFDGRRATSFVIGHGRRNCNDWEGVPNEDWWRSSGTLDPDVGFEEWCRTRDCANLNCSGNLKREAERRRADPLGATTCCNGKVLCIDCGKLRSKYPAPDRYPAKPAWGPPDLGNWNRALAMIGQCIAQHEEVHFREYSCPCSSGYCAPLPPSDGPECSEYRGHTREIACLNVALQQCGGSSRCRDMVQRALTEATNAIKHHKCASP